MVVGLELQLGFQRVHEGAKHVQQHPLAGVRDHLKRLPVDQRTATAMRSAIAADSGASTGTAGSSCSLEASAANRIATSTFADIFVKEIVHLHVLRVIGNIGPNVGYAMKR